MQGSTELAKVLLERAGGLAVARKDRAQSLLEGASRARQHRLVDYRDTAPDYNLFRSLDGAHWEDTHDRILADLLDPGGTHNHGPMFLHSFLRMLSALGHNHFDQRIRSASAKLGRIPDLDHSPVRDWRILRQVDRIDVRIESVRFGVMIFIENKVWSAERENQILDYRRLLDSKIRYDKRFIILLARDEYQTVGNPDFRLSYERDIGPWLGSVTLAAPRIKAIVEQYVEFISKFSSREQTMTWERDLLSLMDTPERIQAVLEIQKVAESHLRPRIWRSFWDAVFDKLSDGLKSMNLQDLWRSEGESALRRDPQAYSIGLWCVLRALEPAVSLKMGLYRYARADFLDLRIMYPKWQAAIPDYPELKKLRADLVSDGWETDKDQWVVGQKTKMLYVGDSFLIDCVTNIDSVSRIAVDLILDSLRKHAPQIEAANAEFALRTKEQSEQPEVSH